MRSTSRSQSSLAELLLAAALVGILVHAYHVCTEYLRGARFVAKMENLPDRTLPDAPSTIPWTTLVLFAAWLSAWWVSAWRRRASGESDGVAGDRLLSLAASLAVGNAWALTFFAWHSIDLTPWLSFVALPAIVAQADAVAATPIRQIRRAPLAMSAVIIAGMFAFNVAQMLHAYWGD